MNPPPKQNKTPGRWGGGTRTKSPVFSQTAHDPADPDKHPQKLQASLLHSEAGLARAMLLMATRPLSQGRRETNAQSTKLEARSRTVTNLPRTRSYRGGNTQSDVTVNGHNPKESEKGKSRRWDTKRSLGL